jgi:hypothetical protein
MMGYITIIIICIVINVTQISSFLIKSKSLNNDVRNIHICHSPLFVTRIPLNSTDGGDRAYTYVQDSENRLRNEFTSAFSDLKVLINNLDRKMDSMESKIGSKMDNMESKMNGMESKIGSKMDNMESKMNGMDSKREGKIDKLDGKLTTVSKENNELKSKLDLTNIVIFIFFSFMLTQMKRLET